MDLGPPELALAVLGVAAFVFAGAATARYGSPLNPLTVFCSVYVGLHTIVSGLAALSPPYGPPPGQAYRAAASVTAWTAVVHLLGVAWPFLYHGDGPRWLFGQIMSACSLDRLPRPLRFRWSILLALFALAAVSYTALALAGGGGTLWLTAPRQAYIGYRAGAGPFYVMCQWTLLFSLTYVLWFRRPRALGTMGWVAAIAGLAYFTGSKHNMLSLSAIAICYYNFRVRRLPVLAYAVLGPTVVTAAFALVFFQGPYPDYRGALAYFQEYFGTTARFIERFDQFGYRWGSGWLSSLWFFVPRGLYPDKPFEYGETLVHQVLFPGAAARGHTPGLMTWTLSYLDFGPVGVFAAGWLHGLWQRATYEYYLDRRENVFAFLLMVHFGLWAMFVMAPAVLLLGWLAVLGLWLRARLRRWPSRDPVPQPVRSAPGVGP